jgi:cytochrome c oxidase assembly protein Cox11
VGRRSNLTIAINCHCFKAGLLNPRAAIEVPAAKVRFVPQSRALVSQNAK